MSPGSSLSLFADDMALYSSYCFICSLDDFSTVQCDISSMSLRITNNHLSLKPAKCHAMMLTHKKLPNQKKLLLPFSSKAHHTLMSTQLSTWKYSSRQIFPSHHTLLICTSKLGISLAWCTEDSTKMPILESYFSYTHSAALGVLLGSLGPLSCHGSWAAGENTEIWSKNWTSDYSNFLSSASIPTLSARRSRVRLSHIIKLMHEFHDVPIDHRAFHYRSRHDNSMAIRPFRCRSTQLLNSFFPSNCIPMELSTSKCSHPYFYNCIQTFYN